MYDGLRDHPGFQRLRDKILEYQDGAMSVIARRLMSGEVVDQREIDFMRGFAEGALVIVEMPEEAEKSLERAAQSAWNRALQEQLTEEEGASPYG